MRRLILFCLSLTALIIAGCGGGGGGGTSRPEGTIKLTVSAGSNLQAQTIGEIDSIRVTVTASDIDTVTRNFKLDPITHTGSDQFQLVAGSQRRFLVEALDKSGTTIYRGEATVDIPADVTTEIGITLTVVNGTVNITVTIHQGPPGIDFTYVPPIGSSSNLQGIITGGTNPKKLAVAVYIKVNGGWWTKPYYDTPLTIPRDDGTWVCAIVTGGYDDQATDVLAYLVKAGASVPQASGGGRPDIPSALAFKEVHR